GQLLENASSPLARRHALRALDGTAQLTPAHLARALSDPDSALREHAILLSEHFLREGLAPAKLWPKLQALAGDPASRVRLQLAFTLGSCAHDDVPATLAAIARNSAADPWITAAILSAPPKFAAQLFAILAPDPALLS